MVRKKIIQNELDYGNFWLAIGVIVLIISFVGTIAMFSSKINITKQECHSEINYNTTKKTYFISKIAEMGELIESTKIDYLFNKCNFPIGVQDYIINYSNTDVTKDMLDLQRHECARFLVMIRDYSQLKDILSDELDSLYVPKEVCNKVEVNEIRFAESCNGNTCSGGFIRKLELDKGWLEDNCECIGEEYTCPYIVYYKLFNYPSFNKQNYVCYSPLMYSCLNQHKEKCSGHAEEPVKKCLKYKCGDYTVEYG